MLKTNPLVLETMQCPIIKPIRIFPGPMKLEKLKKTKNIAIISIILLVCFCSTKHKAHKMVITSNYFSQKAFINF